MDPTQPICAQKKNIIPHSKNQLARMRIVNECLQQKGRFWTAQELIDKILVRSDIRISKRTLSYDIQSLRSSEQLKYYAPIGFCHVNKGYYYTDPDYSFDNLPLNDKDIKALELATTTLDQFRYIPIMAEFTTTIDKIIRVVNQVKKSNHAGLLDFILFEKTPAAEGIHYIEKIIDAIQSKAPISLTYQKFNSATPDTYNVHPYVLKEYRNRWYFIGYNETRKTLRTYGLERIKDISECHSQYIENTFEDIKESLKRCIGISNRNDEVTSVRLHFDANEAHYIRTKALHNSQIIISDDLNGIVIDLTLVINYELIAIILSYGASVTVLKPSSLSAKIIKICNEVIHRS